MRLLSFIFSVSCEGLYHGICFLGGVEESMVLDHLVSQSSENSHSRTQTAVKGWRCVYEQRHVGMRQSWILR